MITLTTFFLMAGVACTSGSVVAPHLVPAPAYVNTAPYAVPPYATRVDLVTRALKTPLVPSPFLPPPPVLPRFLPSPGVLPAPAFPRAVPPPALSPVIPPRVLPSPILPPGLPPRVFPAPFLPSPFFPNFYGRVPFPGSFPGSFPAPYPGPFTIPGALFPPFFYRR